MTVHIEQGGTNKSLKPAVRKLQQNVSITTIKCCFHASWLLWGDSSCSTIRNVNMQFPKLYWDELECSSSVRWERCVLWHKYWTCRKVLTYGGRSVVLPALRNLLKFLVSWILEALSGGLCQKCQPNQINRNSEKMDVFEVKCLFITIR